MTAESTLRPVKFWSRLDDWINPIVVKELRQAVQSRFVVSALLVLLIIQLVAIGIYLITSSSSLFDIDAGRQVFLILFGILLGVSMLFVPLYTAIRLVAERSDTNIDLLFITTIKQRSIIAGKLFAALVLNILIFSACMPFMVFTYFLRGIDLPSIFIVLALGFLTVICCTMLAILVASIPVNRIFKVIFGLIGLWIFLMIYFLSMGASSSLISRGVGSKLGDPDFWKSVLGFLGLCGLTIGLLFSLSVALITPQAANRALPVRIFVSSGWLVLCVGVLIVSWHDKDHTPVVWWQIIFNSIFAPALFVAVSERENLGRRVQRSIPRSVMKRAPAFFFYSGAANGLAWACIGICATLGVAWFWSKLFPVYDNHNSLVDSRNWMGAMCLYFFCYALGGLLLRRKLLKIVSHQWTWMIGLILMLLGIVVPFLTGYFLFFGDQWWREDHSKWLAGNPFAWGIKSGRVFYLSVGGVMAGLAGVLNLGWFIDGVRRFSPRENDQ